MTFNLLLQIVNLGCLLAILFRPKQTRKERRA